MNGIEKIRVIIADSQFLIIEGLRRVLETDGKFSMESVVSTKIELLKAIKLKKPGLLIADILGTDSFGINDFSNIITQNPELPTLILTNSLTKDELTKISAAGIKNIICKTADKNEILTAIEFTLKGKKYYSEEILDMLIDPSQVKKAKGKQGKLTSTEIEIVKLVASGLTAKEIALKKNLSIHTVNTHRKNIFRKMEVTNVPELIMLAIKAGWIDNIEYYI